MGKVCPKFLYLFLFLALAMPLMAQSTIEEPREIDQWFQKLHHAKQKLTHLHFFFHDIISGPNQTSVGVAKAPSTLKSPTFFGQVNIFDDPLTQGPEPTSKLLGRAQGLYGSASQEGFALVTAMNLVFTSGKYNGSILTILGRNPVVDSVRELPVIGGTGFFRLARGFALAKTYLFNFSHAIVEYNIAVLHY